MCLKNKYFVFIKIYFATKVHTNLCIVYLKYVKLCVLLIFAKIIVDNDYFYRSVFDIVNNKGELPDFLEIDILNQTDIYYDRNTDDNNGESELAAIPENEAISDSSSASIGLVFL